MNTKLTLRSIVLGIILTVPLAAQAQHHAGGGFHSGHFSGSRATGISTRYGNTHFVRRSYYSGRPYYGRGYYRGGYNHFYGHLALGVFVATLPLFYDTFWWGGVPYYYSDDTYYRFNDDADKYEIVAPPDGVDAPHSPDQSASLNLFAYPKDGQSAEQQKTDRFECHRWAVEQVGFDPVENAAATPDKKDDYRRAEIACLTGRGYSVQ